MGAVLGLCLALAAAPAGPPVFVPAEAFVLAWTHSIERVRWEERYRVEPPARLRLVQARIKGSAAGMEPPEHARLEAGWFVYTPAPGGAAPLRLTRSVHTPDYELCLRQRCRPMSFWLPSDGGVTLMGACRAGTTAISPRPARRAR